jgi:glycerophosphoryl diester phosphodiesterase
MTGDLTQGLGRQGTPVAVPEVIAHRGYASCYPENTLLAVEAAVAAGVRYIEVDVQLSADGIPVLAHDPGLRRTAGCGGRIAELTLARLRSVSVGERRRLGARFGHVPMATLAELLQQLAGWPHVTAFIEIKRESLARFGTDYTVARIMDVLGARPRHCVPISFDREAVRLARAWGAPQIGWVLRRCTARAVNAARDLAPAFLFCDVRGLPQGPQALPQGSWRWAVYEIGSAGEALALASRGVELVETFRSGELLRALQGR